MGAYRFALDHVCAQSGARAATIDTAHGSIRTPIFMPVGTQASVKGVLPRDLAELDAEIVLANTYHLMLRPGSERIQAAGGLHRFMGWNRAILTDSGGFQVFSLSSLRKLTDDGCAFQSHLDGSRHVLGPERAIALQEAFGSDIMMAFDECPPAKADTATIRTAMRRTTAWLGRCMGARTRTDVCALYGIVQGGVDLALRSEHVDEVCAHDCEGFAIGGLSVGESPPEMWEACAHTAARMPSDKARYLMGVGTPEDLVRCIGAGVDQFDCVMPSRNGRHGIAFTADGKLSVKNRRFFDDDRPLDPDCPCAVCAQFSRSYVRHLFIAGEILSATLLTMHNLAFYVRLGRAARDAVLADRYADWARATLERLATHRWAATSTP
ncbi:MAG: tRNA guanosine(34) transglycosylase Tgt [Myxococcales bacterium]|nr:tRNA guanosine(34) transglycosylase Tgt [Myxococcales bacterium]